MNKNLGYKILNLNKNATKEDIEKSYKNLAFKYHPDKNTNQDSVDKFKQIQEAYEFLIKNNLFSVDLKNSVDDIFDNIYYELFCNKKDSKIRINLNFEESYFGCTKKVEIQDHIFCKNCEGTGGLTWIYCEKCLGKGFVFKKNSLSIRSSCVFCSGKGSIIQEKCNDCKGNGFLKINKRYVDVHIPSGVQDKTQIRVPELGEGGGDLYVYVNVSSNSQYKRIENNLVFNLHVPYSILILGGNFKFDFFQEKKEINIKPRTKIGSKIILKNLGFCYLENPKLKGDLELIINLKYPNEISHKYKNVLKDLLNLEK